MHIAKEIQVFYNMYPVFFNISVYFGRFFAF